MYQLGSKGLALIKSFEGCRLTAYKPVAAEKYYTIGYGHYGADVTKGMKITQAQADAYLVQDCAKFVASVNKYANLPWMNQERFDALVSFTYNCGAGNLNKLLDNGKRSAEQVAASLPKYNKGSGKVLNGLVRRRAAELELFNSNTQPLANKTSMPVVENKVVSTEAHALAEVGKVYTTTVNLNVRSQPSTSGKIVKTYAKGTRFTCKELRQIGYDLWLRTPSGWVAGFYNGTFYFK